MYIHTFDFKATHFTSLFSLKIVTGMHNLLLLLLIAHILLSFSSCFPPITQITFPATPSRWTNNDTDPDPKPQTAILSLYPGIHCTGERNDIVTRFGECMDVRDTPVFGSSKYHCNPYGDLIVKIFSDHACQNQFDEDRYRRRQNGHCWGRHYRQDTYFSMSWKC
jgi:hypothetical protein